MGTWSLAGVAVWAAPSRGSPTRNMAAMSNVEMVRRMVFLISEVGSYLAGNKRSRPLVVMGTLKGFPNPPAVVRRRRSRRATHATMQDPCRVPGDLSGEENS